MENKTLEMPAINKYIIRSTGEEVEVVAHYQRYIGECNSDDWVTYIDSKGVEHIKENFNMQLDFKQGKELNDLFNKVFGSTNFEYTKFPSIDNTRAFETAKSIIVHNYKDVSIEEAITIGKQLAEAFKENKD